MLVSDAEQISTYRLLHKRRRVNNYGLHVANEIFFSATAIAFFDGMITSRQKNDWEHFFEHEFVLCKKIDIQTYHGRSWLEFKVRHLMDLAMNISFEKDNPWTGYTIPFQNIFFPITPYDKCTGK